MTEQEYRVMYSKGDKAHLKAMVKALSSPVSQFFNTDEDNIRLKAARWVLKQRGGK